MGCSHLSECSVQRSCVEAVVVAEGLSWGVTPLPPLEILYPVQRSCIEAVDVAEGLSWGVATLPHVLCRDLVSRWSLLQRACRGV